jgi:hypothetical protein
MKTRGLAILGTGMLAAVLAVPACQSSTSNNPSTGGTAGSSGSGTGGSSGSGTGGSGTGGTGTGGSAGTGTAGTSGSAGSGGSPTDAGCTGQAATVQDVDQGSIAAKTYVKLTGIVATSQKFLVSQSKTTGSCLWGVFVSAPVATAVAYSGLMIISYGDDATTTDSGTAGKCKTGTDAIPDDIKPGDVFNAIGQVTPYAPSACTGTAQQMQVRVGQSCKINVSSHTTPPAPATLDTTTADAIAAGTDTTTLSKWGGVLMRLSNVDANAVDGGTSGIVGPYGVITFQQTALEGHDTIFYDDLSGAGPKTSSKAWQYATATHFNHMDGIIYLDYCTWSLSPRNKCTDIDPASDDCSGG